MKSRLLKISSVITVMLVMLAAISTTAFAADSLAVNTDSTVSVGDTFSYTMNMADCEVPIIGLQMYIVYDHNKLEYVEDSLEFEKIDGVIFNPNLEDTIAINWTNVIDDADFSGEAQLLTLKFKAIADGETEISYYISHMYGDDMGYIKNYTITYDIALDNGTALVTDFPAVVTTDEEFLNNPKRQGSFLNYDDSMGENSPNKDTHQLIQGDAVATTVVEGTEIVSSVVDVTRYETVEDSGSGSTTTILIIAGAVIIVLAIVAVVIVKKRDDAKNRTQRDEIQ